jgi:glycosyltransferase involved in cell wall biosynthesis
MTTRRLLTISHSYPVALNRRLAAELSRAGDGQWQVTAVSPRHYHGDLRDVTLERIADEPNSLRPVDAYGTRSPHLFFYGASLAAMLREGWDVVHVWEEPFVVAGAQIAAWLPRRVPFVFSTAQNIRKRYPPPFAQFEQFVLRRSRGWIAYGQTIARVLGDLPGYRDRPCASIPLGVDVEAFRPDPALRAEARRRLGWADAGPPVVGYLGRLVPEKGVSLMMTALDAARSPWRALMVGGGPMESEVRAWGVKQGDRVRFVPAVPHDEVPLYLNAMDVLCAPSQTLPRWREQVGRMIIEAFACGVAVLGSDSGEIPFTIGDAGLVLPERDANAWTEALGALLDDGARRRDLSARGRQRALSEFAWKVVAGRTLAFLATASSGHD